MQVIYLNENQHFKGSHRWPVLRHIVFPTTQIHCIKTKSYIAQKSVNIHSGLDSKVMHSFTTRMRFSQSSVMMMDTSPVHRIWHAKARYARFLTLPTARVIHIPPAQHSGLSLAGWTRPSFASSEGGGAASGRQHFYKKNFFLYSIFYTVQYNDVIVMIIISCWRVEQYVTKTFRKKNHSRNGQIKKFLTYEKIKRLLWNISALDMDG